MKRNLVILGALLLAAAPALAEALDGGTSHPWLDKQLKKQRYKCPVGDSPFKGPADAPVTIVEFVDYECPYCADEAKTLKEVVSGYPTQVKLVVKNLPLDIHPKAKHKALVAEGMASQGKFWQAYNRMFDGKPMNEVTEGVNEKQLKEFVARGGDGQVGKDLALAKNLGLATTPSFVIDGIRQGGTIGPKQLKLLIDAEIARKAAQVQKG